MGTTTAAERDYRRRLGRVIVQMREATGTSQAKLAEAINRSEAAVSRWETGKATPTAFDLRQIATAFHMGVDTLHALIYPPTVYSPEMERVFESIHGLLDEAATSGAEEGLRRERLTAEGPQPPAPSPVRLPPGTARARG